ncbi:MAG: hypothetical protein AAF682_20785 [Planctomycetota bacterium]
MIRIPLALVALLPLLLCTTPRATAQGGSPAQNYNYCVYLTEIAADGTFDGQCSKPGGCDNNGKCEQHFVGKFTVKGYKLYFWCRCDTGGGLGSCNGVLIACPDGEGSVHYSADCTDDECPDYDTDGDICMDATSFPALLPVCMCYH